MIIQWLSQAVRAMTDWFTPAALVPVPAHRVLRKSIQVFSTAVGLTLLAIQLPGSAWSADQVSTAVKTRKTVAAGFGFQNAEASSITVKTYDADSGEILSEETYELDIKEEGPAVTSQPRERIFAGGVGSGADGLSEFTIRVYDKANGLFLWEGRLNLAGSPSGDVATTPVVAREQPRMALSRIALRTPAGGQPYFLMRAVVPQTGRLVWADQFSPDQANHVRMERISRAVIGMEATAPRDVDFRIRMFDETSRQLLWEDSIVPGTTEEDLSEDRRDSAAGLLPGWSSVQDGKSGQEAL